MKPITEEMKPFVNEHMTREDYRVLGQYLMHKKIDSIRAKLRKVFHREK